MLRLGSSAHGDADSEQSLAQLVRCHNVGVEHLFPAYGPERSGSLR